MDKTININLAGTLFIIEEEAFPLLRDWLQAVTNRLKNSQGGMETIEDIESRVAEIFQAKNGNTGTISKQDVEEMISVVGQPEDFESDNEAEPAPRYSYGRKKMFRNTDDMIIGGVCGGIGSYLNLDPVLFRVLFVLTAFFGGAGILVYLIMWIALPPANTELRKREMYGSSYHSARSYFNSGDSNAATEPQKYNAGYYNQSGIGSAINEIFRAVGKVLFVLMRIFLIFIGISFVITGFVFIMTAIMILVFRLPGIFSPDGVSIHLAYFRDFLNHVFNPSSVPWIIILTLAAVILPMLALIYWGVKMIFWFRARDGIYSLAGFVLWIICVSALSMILFSEGTGFTEIGRSSFTHEIKPSPDTLFIRGGKKVEELDNFKEFSIPDEEYSVYIPEKGGNLNIKSELRIKVNTDGTSGVEITKRSSGRSKASATVRADKLLYDWNYSNDTITLDEYFTIPDGGRWSADNVIIKLLIPETTILYFDSSASRLFRDDVEIIYPSDEEGESWNYDYDTKPWQLTGKFWKITREGLEEASKN